MTTETTTETAADAIGRTIYLASATTKFKLLPNGPRPGEYFCNTCDEYFD